MLTTVSGSGIGDPGSVTCDRVSGSRIPDPGSRTEIVRDYGAFLELEPEWNDAVDRARIPHPFLRHEWVRTWWDSFGGPSTGFARSGQASRQLHIIVVRNDRQIIGIAPLMRESAIVYGLPIRRLALLANDHTPRADFVIAGDPDETYRAIWSTLRQDIDEWDVLQLTQLPKASQTVAATRQFAAAQGLPIGTWKSSDSPYLELTGSWDSYWASLPAKFRSNVRNRLTRLKQIGEPGLEILTERGAIGAALEDAWRLEASGWKDQQGTSICSDPAVQKFYMLLAERASDRGWLRLLFLTVAGKRIAVSYSAIYDDRLFLLKTGHDREFHTCSPFKVLTYLAAQDGYARGLREIDFLGDTEAWKQEWTPSARAHDWLFVFSHSRRARLLHSLKFQMAPEIRKWRA
jgi:CelD/BcsL family acetyltransferase involved in cellulose biosynthesis